MSQQRLPMRKVRDVLRLKAVGLGKRKIAASLGISATAVGGCLRRAREAGVAWPLAEEMTDEALEARLYPASVALAEVAARRPLPDWPTIHRELKRPGVTLQLLWGEHRAAHPDGYGYSRFCDLYRAWEKRLSPTMRQTHVAGEKLFVDYAGTTMRGDRRSDRRGDRGAAVRRRARRLQLHLRGSDLDAGTGRLDRLAHAHIRLHRRRARHRWCPTTSSRASPRRASTSRRSTAPMRRWRPTTTPRSCRRALTSRATRPRSRWRCWWQRAGSSPSSGSAPSSRSPS